MAITSITENLQLRVTGLVMENFFERTGIAGSESLWTSLSILNMLRMLIYGPNSLEERLTYMNGAVR